MSIKFEFLKAGNGDCIFINIDNQINILIDGGIENTYYRELKPFLKKEVIDRGLQLDLVVLTHYDDDHIAGLLKLLEDEIRQIENKKNTIIKELWFNSFDKALGKPINYTNNTSAKQQIKFNDYIKKLLPYISYKSLISIDEIQNIFIGNNQELKITLLSPNNQKLEKLFLKYKKETKNYQTSSRSNDYNKSIEELSLKRFKKDTSLPNGASIAFILEYKNKKFLFLADAHIDLIVDSLKRLDYSSNNKLKLEFIKLSHHGSKKNINQEFLNLIDSNNFIILTSGGKHGHPDKEALSKIILNSNRENSKKLNFICNYQNIVKYSPFSYDEEEKYNFELIYKNSLEIGDKYEK